MSRSPRIAVVDYGVGNLRSAHKAFEHVDVETRLTASLNDIAAADGVVVPGVGAFAGCVNALHATELFDVVREASSRAASGQGVPFLGICVGLQLLFEGSEENPGVAGLGVLPGNVAAIPSHVKSPQMQWNRLQIRDRAHPLFLGLQREPWCYFVHGFSAPIGAETVATCEYGTELCAAVSQERLFATQFHPEKSGANGLAILANFARLCEKAN